MSPKQRLELTWIGKGQQAKLEPRILIENPEKSYGEKDTENKLIFGDNLLTLKALEQDYSGKIKCIFIDPPYNTGSAFTHYDDGVEHSLWLNLMRDRLEILRRLLSEDGSLWVTLDDNEAHYFKVMADEVFGRSCYVTTVIWEKADSPRNSARQFSTDHDYLLVYSKKPEWLPRKLPRTEEANSIYSNPDNDLRGDWLPGDPYANKPYSKGLYTIKGPTNREFSPPPGRYWRISEEKLRELDADGRIWWGPNGSARPSIKRYLSEVSDLVPRTLWTKDQVGSNRTSKNEMRYLFPGGESFGTPKPERLIERILQIATVPGDIVLDSFAGSGTTGAVAHKMGRKWAMIELGDHCHTHIIPRLQKVIDGTDLGGVSTTAKVEVEIKLCKSCKDNLCEKCTEALGESQKGGEQVWFGGGGFKYYYLAPSLLKEDKYGNWIIDESYNPDMLAAAMAKHEAFQYQPDESIYWKQGQSTEKDFIFTTTNFVTVEFLDKIYEEMQSDESLLICCKSFRKDCEERYPNITLKKIPKMLLGRCEFGRDDYSLNVINLPTENDEELLEEFVLANSWNDEKNGRKKSDEQMRLSLMGE